MFGVLFQVKDHVYLGDLTIKTVGGKCDPQI